jgi:hypothetical protein
MIAVQDIRLLPVTLRETFSLVASQSLSWSKKKGKIAIAALIKETVAAAFINKYICRDHA